MQLSCPHCGFSKEIDPSKLPAGAKRATCPKCRQKFDLNVSEPSGLDKPQQAAPPPPPPPGDMPPIPEPEQPPTMEEMLEEEMAPPPPPLPPMEERTGFGAQARAADIPWEERQGTLFGDLWATTKMVLFNPPEFFDRMPKTGGHSKPLTFALIIGSIGMIFSLLWQLIFVFIGAGLSSEMPEMPVAAMGGGFIIGMMILSPLLVIIGLYIGAFFLHLFLMIVRGADGGFEATFRVLAYGMATYIFNIVPFLGGLVSGGWMLVLMIIGLPRAHFTGVGRVLVAIFVIPFALLIIFGIGMGVLVGVLSNL